MMHDEKSESPREGGPPLVHDASPTHKLGKQAHRRIGTHLRAMYESVVQQPIPSRFTDLIARLDDAFPAAATDDTRSRRT